MKTLLAILVLTFLLPLALKAGPGPSYWNEIQAFKRADSIAFPAANGILFIGSSSFTKWTDVKEYFPGYPIINRGFGGSTLEDVIRYVYDIVLPYKPKQVVVYCGDNDLAHDVPADEVVLRFKTLFAMIRTNLPHARIDFVSIKKSPSRAKFYAAVDRVNHTLAQFLKKQPNADYIDVTTGMLDASGQPREELFLPDRLHMKPAGYAIWKTAMLPYLLK
ncbi:G-D-S-L family lipolytic protein [Chitinophaga parva]|uniref:G-D-S-L family lipolytic protein n=1 Tax=Chitinophaga parva TaxID=2169414 RepID=A0A2T7BDN6_9BACT|nr:GDSL-type esterase/lipase family protein [Chitinophaga parva]PUZ23140.1 G-D-S-L family lipolytic protein [Chitinophaga parva]